MTRSIVILFISFLVLISCSTGPDVNQTVDRAISLRLLPADEVDRRFGPSQQENPFSSPKGIISKNQEFLVIEIKASLDRGNTLELYDIKAKSTAGVSLANYLPMEEFLIIMETYKTGKDMEDVRRTTVEHNYLPSRGKRVSSKGTMTAVVVMIGKAPIPRPIELTADFLINGNEGMRVEAVVE